METLQRRQYSTQQFCHRGENNWAQKRKWEKFLFINPFRTKISFEDISGKICQNFGKKCPVRLFLGEFVRVAQNISKTGSQQAEDSGNCLSLTRKILRYFYNSERYSLILLRPVIMLVYSHCRWSSEWYECFKFNGLFQIWKVDLLFLGQNFMWHGLLIKLIFPSNLGVSLM